MKSFLARVCLVSIGLTSCVDGVLEVNYPLKLKNKKDDMILVRPGSYNADINIKKLKKKLVLDIKGEKKVIFDIPKGTYVPKHEGVIELSSYQTGQPVDLVAEVQTEFTRSAPRQKILSCSRVRTYSQCIKTAQNTHKWINQSISLAGDQVVHFHHEVIEKFYTAELYAKGSRNLKATFTGDTYNSSYVEDEIEPCRVLSRQRAKFRRIKADAEICPRLDKPPKPTRPPRGGGVKSGKPGKGRQTHKPPAPRKRRN